MSKSGYSRSGLFGTINHYDSHGHDTASCARVYQAVVTADKRRRSQRVEHDVRAKQTKVCDAERPGLPSGNECCKQSDQYHDDD